LKEKVDNEYKRLYNETMKTKIMILTVIASLTVLFAVILFRGEALEISGIQASKKSAEAQPAGGIAENHPQSNDSCGYEVELTGVLRLIGSAPRYEYVITSDGVDHYIEADAEEKKPLLLHQGKKVKVKGILIVNKHIYPDPVYNHEKRSIYPDTIEVY